MTEILTDSAGNFVAYKGSLMPNGTPITDINTIAKQNTKDDKAKYVSVSANDLAETQADPPRQVVYGQTRVGGNITFFTTDNAQGGEFLHIFVTLSGHEITAVQKLYLDDKEVQFGGGTTKLDPRWGLSGTVWDDKVFMAAQLGLENQAAQPDLVAQSSALFPGLWTTDHKQKGCGGAYILLAYNNVTFPNGPPSLQFRVQGKPCYDPRTGLTVYTTNAALIIADYLVNEKIGARIAYSKIDEPALIDAANICDELVALNGGGTQARYTINCAFKVDQPPRLILESMRSAIGGGSISRLSGKIVIRPAAWRAPVMHLTDEDLRGPVRYQTRVARRDNYNFVKGTFSSPNNQYAQTDFPAVTNALYLSQDNNVPNALDLVLPFVASNATAQRIAKIYLERARQQAQHDASWSMKAYELQPGDNVEVSSSRLGLVQKPYEVISRKPSYDINAAPCIDLGLRETAQGVTDWAGGAETLVDLAPDTFLPSPSGVQALLNLQAFSGTPELFVNGDSTVITRVRLTWNSSTDPFAAGIEIEFKPTSESQWQRNPSVDALTTQAYVVNVQDLVEYDFRVRQFNGSGFRSAWTTLQAHFVLGKSAPPSDVVNFGATVRPYEIYLSWNQNPDVDRDHIEIRSGGADWDSSAVIAEPTGTSFTITTSTAGTYKYFARFVDTSGNYSFFPSAAEITIPGPSIPDVTIAFAGADVVFSWEQVTSFFAIDHYEVSFGATYAGSTKIADTYSTAYTLTVDWTGIRSFYVVSVDVAGNKSAPFAQNISINIPGKVTNIVPNLVDNFVTLSWTAPVGSILPISKYRIYRGDVFGSAALIGDVGGTFFTHFEAAGGTYTYWIVPINSADTAGTEEFITVNISPPRDYVLEDDQFITSWDTFNNVIQESNGDLVGPVFTNETFQSHFTDRSWSTIGNQIDAGFPYYIQPGAVDGFVERKIDYGTVFASILINVTWDLTVVDSPLNVYAEISWSEDDVSYTTAITNTILAQNVRYVKVKLIFDGSDGTSLGVVKATRVKLDVRLVTDEGRATSNAADIDGTFTQFNLDYIDVRSIAVTPISNTEVRFAYTFDDVPNPTGFNVFIWDSVGARTTREFTWIARGVLN